MKLGRGLLATNAVISLISAVGAQAQWVMVARAVRGRIERMTNKPANGGGYDVATVSHGRVGSQRGQGITTPPCKCLRPRLTSQ